MKMKISSGFFTSSFKLPASSFKFFILLALSLLISLPACDEKTAENGSGEGLSTDVVGNKSGTPVMTFEETMYDFGDIIDGEVVMHTFEFKNTGEGPLVISGANSSCGCTVPEYPREPVEPGKKGKITVKFDSSGKKGLEEKTVTIVANTEPSRNEIKIKANIKPKS